MPASRAGRRLGTLTNQWVSSKCLMESRHSAGTRARDVQPGKMGHVLLSMTYMRTALIRGIENANKHAPDSRAYGNGGLMEGISSGSSLRAA